MSSRDKTRSRWPRLALIFPLGLLVDCASTPHEAQETPSPGHIVVGSGTDADHTVITSTSQQMMNAESGASPEMPPTAAAPNRGLP